jgi:hypothetical protein
MTSGLPGVQRSRQWRLMFRQMDPTMPVASLNQRHRVTVRHRWLDQNFNSVPSDERELAAHPALVPSCMAPASPVSFSDVPSARAHCIFTRRVSKRSDCRVMNGDVSVWLRVLYCSSFSTLMYHSVGNRLSDYRANLARQPSDGSPPWCSLELPISD